MALYSSKVNPANPVQVPIVVILQCYSEGKEKLVLKDGNSQENGLITKGKMDFSVRPLEHFPYQPFVHEGSSAHASVL